MKQGLLERLAEQMDVLYLSDLRQPRGRAALLRQLTAICASEYSFEEWCDAVCYLADSPDMSIRDQEEAKSYLINCLKK